MVNETSTRQLSIAYCVMLMFVGFVVPRVQAEALPPVPVPPENPITEEKRVLGKVLFWDEQLSSSNTMACGTCHRPGSGSTDPRIGRHPGFDRVAFTDDDILGSPGVPRTNVFGDPVDDRVFGFDPQVTRRTAPPVIGSQYMIEMFWDGHAANFYRDPVTRDLLIDDGGNFEHQALEPILNHAEMSHEKREWLDVVLKLEESAPLALAGNVPVDMSQAIDQYETYPRLFEAAFGDPDITPTRIAYAIATYERTLFPDQTPWDAFEAGDTDAITPAQQRGWVAFLSSACTICHRPPVFSDASFRNIGLRPLKEDGGLGDFLDHAPDRGKFKVPTLRNVSLRPRLMHTGQVTDVHDAIDFYLELNGHQQFPENRDHVMDDIALPVEDIDDLADFIQNALLDPRVAAEIYPFDRPTLHSETLIVDINASAPSPILLSNSPNPFPSTTTLRFDVAAAGTSRLVIFDAQGRRIRVLRDGASARGATDVLWDGTDERGRPVAPGLYFYEFTHRTTEANDRVSGRMVYAP